MNIGKLDWHQLSRRRFLIGSVGAAIGIAALGSEMFGSPAPADARGDSADDGRLLVFSASNALTLTAFAEAVLPRDPLFPSMTDTQLIQRCDEELYFVDEAIRADVGAALDLLEWLPVVRGYFSRFSRMPATERAALIESMLASRIETLRAVANNLKIVVHFLYYAHPATWALTGYDGPFARLEPKQSEQRLHYALRRAKA